jgi:hypothetical protein
MNQVLLSFCGQFACMSQSLALAALHLQAMLGLD